MAIIRLAPSSDAVALIHVDDLPAPCYIGWDASKKCYRDACNNVLDALSSYRNILPFLETPFLLTDGSKHWIRDDRLSGALLWSYNLSLLGEIIPILRCVEIQLECDAPVYFLSECKRLFSLSFINREGVAIVATTQEPLNLAKRVKNVLKSSRYNYRQVLYLYKCIKKRRTNLYSCGSFETKENANKLSLSSSIVHKNVIIGIQGFTTHRFGSLLRDLKNEYAIVPFSPHENALSEALPEPGFISLYQFIGKFSFASCLVKISYLLLVQVICLHMLRRVHPFFSFFFRQSYTDILHVVFNQCALGNTVRALKPVGVIAQGSYNGPHTKRIFYSCRRNSCPSISIEQKAIFSTHFAYQRNPKDSCLTFPDIYIVGQGLSRNTLLSWGVSPKNISVGFRGSTLNAEKTARFLGQACDTSILDSIATDTNSNKSLLLLLSDSLCVNKNLIKYISNLPCKECLVLVREHPSVPLGDQPEVIAFLNDLKWIDCSSLPWTLISSLNNPIAITACSSSGLEAIQRGALLIWLPFCSDLSVVHASMIDCIGLICFSPEELVSIFNKLKDVDVYASLVGQQSDEITRIELTTSGHLSKVVMDSLNSLNN